MTSWLLTWALHTADLFRLMAPYLLLGLLLAGLLHVVVPRGWVARHMAGRGWFASAKAALVGIPLPLCSCGVIPFADSLRRQGASKSTTTSFLISTPQTGVDSILATSAMLGLPLAAWRVLTALVSGVLGGVLVGATESRRPGHADHALSEAGADLPRGLKARIREMFSYGMGMLVEDIAFWLVVGLAAGGAISAFVPSSFFTQQLGHPLLQMGAVLAVSVPLYVCATGSIPVAAAMVAKGLPMGAAVVFLIAGPATNVATLTVFSRVLGRRVVAIYLGTILVASIAFGLAFEALFPHMGLPPALSHHHETGPMTGVSWLEWATSAVLVVAMVRALYGKGRERLRNWGRTSPEPSLSPATGDSMGTIELSIEGMTCRHCQGNVKQALTDVEGVEQVEVFLEEGAARVKGDHVDPARLVKAVEDSGYEARARRPGDA